jgi:hypothetical protein
VHRASPPEVSRTFRVARRGATPPLSTQRARLRDLGDPGTCPSGGCCDLGINALIADHPPAQLDLTDLTGLVDTIAQEDVATAFSLWAHRMVLDYLARPAQSLRWTPNWSDGRPGQRIGSTAMASGVKALAGIDALPVTAVARRRWTHDSTALIPWASNLTP